VRALDRGGQPLLHDPRVVNPRREAPQVHEVEEVAQVVGLLRGPLPAADDLAEEVLAPAVGTVEDEATHPAGVRQRQLLRDRAAHRRAHDVRVLDAERVHERDRVGREARRAVLARRGLGAPHATVVERRDTPAVSETHNLVVPARALVGEAGHEDDVFALSCLLGVQLHATCIDHSHRAILDPPRLQGSMCGRRLGRSVSRYSPPPTSVIWTNRKFNPIHSARYNLNPLSSSTTFC